MSVFIDFINALLSGLSSILEGLSYVLFVVVQAIISLSDFDPFLGLIDKYSPQSLIGSEFSSAWSFACGWVPVRETVVLIAVFFGILGLCVVFRLVYNWVKFGSSGGGSE